MMHRFAKVARPLRFVVAAAALVLATGCEEKASTAAGAAPAQAPAAPPGPVEGRLVEIKAEMSGYAPKEIPAKVGETLTLRFTRVADSACLAEVVFPALKITKPLPLKTPVDVVVKADKAGNIDFQCGMAMVFGKIVVSG